MLVGEQDDVDRQQGGGLDRRPGRLDRPARVLAGRRERRVGQPAQTSVVEDRGGAATSVSFSMARASSRLAVTKELVGP